MTKQKFYDLSKKSFGYWSTLGKLCGSSIDLWLLRYAAIVDKSDRKLECPYAAMAMRYSGEDNEKAKLLETLRKMRTTIDEWTAELERNHS